MGNIIRDVSYGRIIFFACIVNIIHHEYMNGGSEWTQFDPGISLIRLKGEVLGDGWEIYK